jgi:hypothetical protein
VQGTKRRVLVPSGVWHERGVSEADGELVFRKGCRSCRADCDSPTAKRQSSWEAPLIFARLLAGALWTMGGKSPHARVCCPALTVTIVVMGTMQVLAPTGQRVSIMALAVRDCYVGSPPFMPYTIAVDIR